MIEFQRQIQTVPSLVDGTLYIWQIDLDRGFPFVDSFAEMLQHDELQRAQRFYFERDRNRFIVARAWTRMILATFLQVRPQTINFVYNDYGKPFLLRLPHSKNLNFNVSHSHHLALVAVGRATQIGVDIEKINPDFATLDIAKRYFAPLELQVLKNQSRDKKVSMFFECWTRKEAYIKAKGKGLSLPLDSFVVDLDSNSPGPLLNSLFYKEDVTKFEIGSLEVEKNFKAAYAINEKVNTIKKKCVTTYDWDSAQFEKLANL